MVDAKVADRTDQHERVGRRQAVPLTEIRDHLFDDDRRGGLEGGSRANRHEPVRRLQARPALSRRVAETDPHRDTGADLDSGARDLAVPHRRVNVADIEKGALDLRA